MIDYTSICKGSVLLGKWNSFSILIQSPHTIYILICDKRQVNIFLLFSEWHLINMKPIQDLTYN